PSPKPDNPELDALRRDNAALREQVAALLKAASRDEAISDAKKTLKRLGALEHENEALKTKLAKAEADPDERGAALERHLKRAHPDQYPESGVVYGLASRTGQRNHNHQVRPQRHPQGVASRQGAERQRDAQGGTGGRGEGVQRRQVHGRARIAP